MKLSKVKPFVKPISEGESLWIVQDWYYDATRKPLASGVGADKWFPTQDGMQLIGTEADMKARVAKQMEARNKMDEGSAGLIGRSPKRMTRVRKVIVESDKFYTF